MKVLERRVHEAEEAETASQATVASLSSQVQVAMNSMQEVRERCSRFKSCVDGCLSRLASYEQRIDVANRRLVSFRGIYIVYTHDISINRTLSSD